MTTLMGRIDWGRVTGTLLVIVTAILFYGRLAYCALWALNEIAEVFL